MAPTYLERGCGTTSSAFRYGMKADLVFSHAELYDVGGFRVQERVLGVALVA